MFIEKNDDDFLWKMNSKNFTIKEIVQIKAIGGM